MSAYEWNGLADSMSARGPQADKASLARAATRNETLKRLRVDARDAVTRLRFANASDPKGS